MKLRGLISFAGFLCPEVTLAQYVSTVRIPTGTCALSSSATGPSLGSASGGEGSLTAMSSMGSAPSASGLSPSGSSGGVSGSVVASSPAASSTFTPPTGGFLITFSPSTASRNSPLRARQGSLGYIDPNGHPTQNCYASTIYTVNSNGTLCAQAGSCFSTSPGTPFQPFVPSTTLQSISTTWEFSGGNDLVWTNALFLVNNPAIFCFDKTLNTIEVYFQVLPPSSCTPLFLSSAPLSQCPGIGSNSTTSALSSMSATKSVTSGLPIPSASSVMSGAAASSSLPSTFSSFTGYKISSMSGSAPTYPSSSNVTMSSTPASSAAASSGATNSSTSSTASSVPTSSMPTPSGNLSSSISSSPSSPAPTDSSSNTASVSSTPSNSTSITPTGSSSSVPSSASGFTGTSVGGSSSTGSSTTSPSSSAPSPDGMAYHGYIGPVYNGNNDVSQYNGNSSFKVSGVAADVNFESTFYAAVIFPEQTQVTNVSDPAYAVVYQGFFLAPASATYTLTTTLSTDDFGYIWTGTKAYSTWSDSNYDAMSTLNTNAGNVTFQLSQGQELPVTIVWVNAANAGGLNITIYNSVTGVTLSDTTGYFVSPKASDGFSNGVGTIYYSGSSSFSTSATTAATTGLTATTAPTTATTANTGTSAKTGTTVNTGTTATTAPTAATTASTGKTATTVPTGTTSAPTAATTLAGPTGLVYGAFTNPGYDSSNISAGITYFNSDNNILVSCGSTTNPNFGNQPGSYMGYLPGQSTLRDLSEIAVVFHGYFVPPVTGTYYFGTSSDDFGFVWAGTNAFTGWTSSNYVANNGAANPIAMTAGAPMAVTFLYVNSGANCTSFFEYTPDGGANYYNNFTGLFLPPNATDSWSPMPESECTPPTGCDANGFYEYYFGSGYVFNSSAPANYNNMPITTNYTKSDDEAVAAAACGAYTKQLTYLSFDLHFDDGPSVWYCVSYAGYSNDTSYWDVPVSSVTQGYGYSVCP